MLGGGDIQVMRLPISDIRIGTRHRKDLGDLQSLATSIDAEGLLQPIGVTETNELVFGERRLRACADILGWTDVEVRVVDVSSIVAGEFHENEVRKDFTPSERVAIERTINAEIERRQGARTDLSQDFARSEKDRTSKESARLAGFGNRETARQARTVVETGTPELVEAMDKGDVSISAAAEMASEPQEEQRKRLDLPSRKEALEESKRTGQAVLGRDGKYHAHVPPEREAQTDLWLKCKDAIWALTELDVEPAELVEAVPSYQHDEFVRRIGEARGFLEGVCAEWEKAHVKDAAE